MKHYIRLNYIRYNELHRNIIRLKNILKIIDIYNIMSK